MNRKRLRLKNYDYSKEGAYFVTVYIHDRHCLFGEITDGHMILNKAGEMVAEVWKNLSRRFTNIEMDYYIVMPNHFHGIIQICRGDPCDRPNNLDHSNDRGEYKIRPYGTMNGSLGRIVQAFKSQTTHKYIMGIKMHGWFSFNKRLWQRSYYDHIIRNDADLNRIRAYITTNPIQWELDENNLQKMN